MLNWIISLDTDLFRFFNETLANPLFDWAMPVITSELFVRSLFVLIVLSLAVFGKKEGRITALLCILTVVLSDQVSSQTIKPLVHRVRPCHVLPDVHLLVGCSQGLSFPSSHAVNSFGQATLLALRYPKFVWPSVIVAFVVSYSRIAVGVHYPFDLLAGMAIGALCGTIIFSIFSFLRKKILDERLRRL